MAHQTCVGAGLDRPGGESANSAAAWPRLVSPTVVLGRLSGAHRQPRPGGSLIVTRTDDRAPTANVDEPNQKGIAEPAQSEASTDDLSAEQEAVDREAEQEDTGRGQPHLRWKQS